MHKVLQSSVRKMLTCQENRDPPPPPHTHTLHMHTLQYTCIQYYTVICQENACLLGSWRPPPHTHTYTTMHTIHYTCIQSSVRKMLACQENRDPPPPPPTHTHTLHMHTLHYTCIQYYTVICQENACLSGSWRPPPPPPPHTHI